MFLMLENSNSVYAVAGSRYQLDLVSSFSSHCRYEEIRLPMEGGVGGGGRGRGAGDMLRLHFHPMPPP